MWVTKILFVDQEFDELNSPLMNEIWMREQSIHICYWFFKKPKKAFLTSPHIKDIYWKLFLD